jgi:hypothetical protein
VSYSLSHSKYTSISLLNGRVQTAHQTESQSSAQIGRLHNTVVPQAARTHVGRSLLRVVIDKRFLESVNLLALLALKLNQRQDLAGLLATHHANLSGRKHVKEAGRVSTTAHAVVTCTVGGAQNGSDFGNVSISHG